MASVPSPIGGWDTAGDGHDMAPYLVDTSGFLLGEHGGGGGVLADEQLGLKIGGSDVGGFGHRRVLGIIDFV